MRVPTMFAGAWLLLMPWLVGDQLTALAPKQAGVFVLDGGAYVELTTWGRPEQGSFVLIEGDDASIPRIASFGGLEVRVPGLVLASVFAGTADSFREKLNDSIALPVFTRPTAGGQSVRVADLEKPERGPELMARVKANRYNPGYIFVALRSRPSGSAAVEVGDGRDAMAWVTSQGIATVRYYPFRVTAPADLR